MPDSGYQNLGPKTLLTFILRKTAFFTLLLIILLVLRWLTRYLNDNNLIGQYVSFINRFFLLLIFIDLALLLLMLLVAWWQYKNFKFKIDDESFKITRGVLTRQEIALPYRRIESIDLKAPLMFQILGVCRLTIETVTEPEDEADIQKDSDDEVIPVVDRALAETIQEELTKRANIQRMNIRQK